MGNTICGVGVGSDDLPVPVPVPLLLPEEVLIEILLWLPVISLLRFKSVCKSWRDLIQSPYFIHLHTTNTFNSSSSASSSNSMQLGGETFILQTHVSSLYKLGGDRWWDRESRGWVREQNMFMLSFGSGSSDDDDDDDDEQVVFKLDNLGFPPYYKIFPWTHLITMVGSCNGLICLHDFQLKDVSLWNPATRQFRILPKSIPIQEKAILFSNDFVAFGFDVKTKDYKVVKINFFTPTYIAQWQPGYTCQVQVYSLSTDSWRLLEGIHSLLTEPSDETFYNHGLYLNGSYFFVGTKCPLKEQSIEELNEQGEIRNNNLIVSFDFTKEIFTTMQLHPDHDDRYSLLLTHLGDKIALFTTRMKSLRRPSSSFGLGGDDDQSSCDCDDDEYYDIWVLNEQGGDVNKESSWAKLHSYQIKDRGASWILPRGILNNGEFALIETRTEYRDDVVTVSNELHLLNLVTKESKKSFPISDKLLTAAIYKHSLVSIIGGNGAAAAADNRVVGDAMCPIVN